MLIREIAGGEISSEVIDVYPEPVEDFRVEISFAHVDRLIGNPIEPAIIRSILESLEIRVVEENAQGMVLHVPPYRVDVQREADIIEEILRIYGFNRVEISKGLRSTLSATQKTGQGTGREFDIGPAHCQWILRDEIQLPDPCILL